MSAQRDFIADMLNILDMYVKLDEIDHVEFLRCMVCSRF